MVRRTNGGRWWARGASAMLAAALVVPLATSGASAHDGHPHAEDPEFSALVFSKTALFRHASIPAGVAAIEQLGEEHGFAVDHTEDATDFTEENLADYDVVIWLSTTGDVLNDEQQDAFEQYIQAGGGYAGIHAASDTEYDWPWYGELVGAYFASHPPGTPNADVAVVDQVHPSTAHLPMTWNRTDEWYNYRDNPRGDVHVLATLDETTYAPGNNAMGTDHPIAWCHNYDGGRSWYTGGGHTNESFSEPEFVQHLLGGIRTAAGVEGADCTATVESSFEQVTLARGGNTIGEPIALAVLPGGDVLHTARDGRVFYTTADASTRTAATIPVYNHDEDGLQGIAIDPNFAENRWVYLYYAPPLDTPPGDAPENGPPSAFEPFEGHNSLSRFQLLEDGTLDLASEQEILRVAADRGICCHAGGEIDFDAEGNLYLSTGDDTNPFASDGYTPIDERENRNPAFDARRTSGNTNDLRGKLIRIDVMDEIADGAEPGPGSTYTIPSGNLFDADEYTNVRDLVRDEIYAMGFRNPFRFAIDQETGWVHLGDYGPDAGSANPNRGPGGQVEFNIIKEPGNYGWPFCHGANDAYNDYDFATGTSGPKFDCDNLVNDSPHNTGLTELPPAIPAWLPYDGGSVPELGSGSESPMGGPTYRYDPELDSPTKWPEYYDGKTFNYEWGRGWIREFVIDEDGGLVDIVPSFEWLDLAWPMNVEFGPDGAMYILDYGRSWFGGDEFSALYRVDYVGQLNPVARIEASATSGALPLTVEFDASTSTDPDGQDLTFEWDFDNDGTIDATGVTVEHTFTDPGVHTVRLNAVSGDGRVGTATVNITAGNTAPTVELEIPEDGSIFYFGDRVPFRVTVTDPEDGEIDCADVIVEYILGHDSHGHPLSRVNGCEGTIPTAADEGHGLDANVFGIINARYADQGGEGGVPSLTGDDEAMLRLRQQQAEFYDDASGVNIFAKDGAAGGQQVGDIHNGDWIAFDPLNFVNIDGVSFRFTSGGAGGTVEVRQGSVDGHLAATVELGNTGGWEVWEVSDVVELDALPGTGPVYFVFTGHETDALFDIDEIRYSGRGAADNVAPTVQAQATPTSGEAPLEVTFTATATDPDGDDVTLTWDFGDGATGEGAEVTHTYTAAGTYTATVTATDSGGARSTATVTVNVGAPPSQCLDVWRDDFDGDALDTERWSVVRQDHNLRVADGSLVMPTSNTDIYGTNNSASPNLVLQDLPDGPFTATTQVTMEGTGAYQQAGLLIYGDDDNYAKMVFQERSDNRADRVFQFIREENGVPNEVGASNSPALGASYPTTAWVRFSSDGENLTASYSADGVTFTDMAETKSLAGIENPRIGLFAVQGADRPQAPVDASFDFFSIATQAAGGEVGPSDEFDGTALDECRWEVVRPAPEHLRVVDGWLELDATPGDIYGGDNQTPANFVLQDLGDEDWTVETVVDMSETTRQYEQGGLMVYVDDDNYVKFDVLATNSAGSAVSRQLEIRSEIGGVVQNPQPSTSPITATTVHLQLAKEGDTFTGSYSVDGGETWASLQSLTNAVVAAEGRTGLFALGASSTLEPTIRFDYFRVLGDEPPVCEPGEVEEGYTALFDGTQASLDEWRMAGPGSFELQDDCTALTVGGMGLLWYPEEFGNYSLKLDWKMSGDDNSGVFVGFPDPGDDPWVAVNQGYEIQIDATDQPDRTTGAIYTFQGADQEARDEALNPPGEWNSYEIVVEGQNIKVYLNDVLINDFDSTHPDRDLASGFIGLQNHGAGDDVYFRNVRIADLPDEPVEPVLIPVEKVSIGLYSLIPWVNAEGLPTVLARLAEIGLENIEPYGGNLNPYTAEQFRAMVDEIGLRVPSSHYNVGEANFDATLAYVQTLGQEYVGSGGFAAPGIGTYENTLATAATMNRLGERSVEAGVGKFFGHNHAVEFTTVYEHEGEQMSAWEILVAETNPEFVTFQVDVAWAAHAGVDVPALLEEYGDRIELLHIKDAVNLGGAIAFTNLGEGEVPLQDILRAAEEHANIAYYVMEYDVAPQGEDFVVTGFEYLTGQDAGEEGSRPVEVTPAAVTFTDEDGTEDDTYTIPWDVGVEYLVDGAVVAPGTYPGSGTVTVTVRTLDGFELAEGATTEWTHTFSTGGGTPTDPVEAAHALSRSFERYVSSGDVAGPIAGQLARTLDQVTGHLQAGRQAQAERALELFVRHLDNPKRTDTLSAAAQADLRGQVEVIFDLLG